MSEKSEQKKRKNKKKGRKVIEHLCIKFENTVCEKIFGQIMNSFAKRKYNSIFPQCTHV